VDAPIAMKPASSTVISVVLINRAMCVIPLLVPHSISAALPIELGMSHYEMSRPLFCSGHGTRL
jgi:hypothetical protein